MRGQQEVSLPMIDLGGLCIIVGGFIAFDYTDEDAVELTYVGGSTRILTKGQSDVFLRRVGLKKNPFVEVRTALGIKGINGL